MLFALQHAIDNASNYKTIDNNKNKKRKKKGHNTDQLFTLQVGNRSYNVPIQQEPKLHLQNCSNMSAAHSESPCCPGCEDARRSNEHAHVKKKIK